MPSALRRMRSDRGATAVEYGLIVALIAIIVIPGLILLQRQLDSIFGDAAAAYGTVSSPASTATPTPTGTPTCATRALGTITFTRHTGSGDGLGTHNVLGSVPGAVLLTASEIGNGSITWAANGDVTWTYPSGANRSTAVSFGYSATGCTGGSGSATFRTN